MQPPHRGVPRQLLAFAIKKAALARQARAPAGCMCSRASDSLHRLGPRSGDGRRLFCLNPAPMRLGIWQRSSTTLAAKGSDHPRRALRCAGLSHAEAGVGAADFWTGEVLRYAAEHQFYSVERGDETVFFSLGPAASRADMVNKPDLEQSMRRALRMRSMACRSRWSKRPSIADYACA